MTGDHTMRAVVLEAFGGPETLRPTSVDRPRPSDGEILVRVHACGVCGHDLLARTGALGTRLPQILGHEIAGEVEQSAAPGFAPGDPVVLNQRLACGSCAACIRGEPNLCTRGGGFYGEDVPGGYAEYVIARASNAVHLPVGVSTRTAATLPCGVGTGLHALHRSELTAGETVLVTGANGGVGIHVVALARLFGATVIAVIRSAEVQDDVRAAGAEEVIVAPAGFFHRAVRAWAPDGVDVAIDCVGTPTIGATLRSVRSGGRIAVVGNVDPSVADLGLGLVILKELSLLGSSHATPAELAEAVELVSSGRLTPVIARTFPLEEAADAHAFAEGSTATGRVVLRVV